MRKPMPGYSYFICIECEQVHRERSRDCLSPSGDICPVCSNTTQKIYEIEHLEWPTDSSGNLLI